MSLDLYIKSCQLKKKFKQDFLQYAQSTETIHSFNLVSTKAIFQSICVRIFPTLKKKKNCIHTPGDTHKSYYLSPENRIKGPSIHRHCYRTCFRITRGVVNKSFKRKGGGWCPPTGHSSLIYTRAQITAGPAVTGSLRAFIKAITRRQRLQRSYAHIQSFPALSGPPAWCLVVIVELALGWNNCRV